MPGGIGLAEVFPGPIMADGIVGPSGGTLWCGGACRLPTTDRVPAGNLPFDVRSGQRVGLAANFFRIEELSFMKKLLVGLLEKSIQANIDGGVISVAAAPPIEMELTKDPRHGDYASNAAMILAAQAKKNPREIAKILSERIDDSGAILEKVEVAGPGFMNFFIREGCWASLLEHVDREGDRYGSADLGKGRRIQVEFVSANPTGPLHIGHARGAVVGDVMANILAAVGYRGLPGVLHQ